MVTLVHHVTTWWLEATLQGGLIGHETPAHVGSFDKMWAPPLEVRSPMAHSEFWLLSCEYHSLGSAWVTTMVGAYHTHSAIASTRSVTLSTENPLAIESSVIWRCFQIALDGLVRHDGAQPTGGGRVSDHVHELRANDADALPAGHGAEGLGQVRSCPSTAIRRAGTSSRSRPLR